MMLPVSFYELLQDDTPLEIIRLDPSRMAQGVMTGIGFLGAGVIVKEGITVKGMTTAAAIWLTAAIGIAIGTGLYLASTIALVLAMFTLTIMRKLSRKYIQNEVAYITIRFPTSVTRTEGDLTGLILSCDVNCSNVSYSKDDTSRSYTMMLSTKEELNFTRLAKILGRMDDIEFDLNRTGISA